MNSGFQSGFLVNKKQASKAKSKNKTNATSSTSAKQQSNLPPTKPAQTAFDYYCAERRTQLTEVELTNEKKFLEKEWKGLSDYMKKSYVEMERKDKSRWGEQHEEEEYQELVQREKDLRSQIEKQRRTKEKAKAKKDTVDFRRRQKIHQLKKVSDKDDKMSMQHTKTQRVLALQKSNVTNEIATLLREVNEVQAALRSAAEVGDLLLEKEEEKKEKEEEEEKEKKSKGGKGGKGSEERSAERSEEGSEEGSEETKSGENQVEEEEEDEYLDDLAVCMICMEPVDTRSACPKKSFSIMRCNHSFHLTCIGKRVNQDPNGYKRCPFRCLEERKNTWKLRSDTELVGLLFNVLRDLKNDSVELKNYDEIFKYTDPMGLSRKAVRGALGTLARGYLTRQGNSVIITGERKPELAGSAVAIANDDGHPQFS